jgi:succinate dehydrogenase / fumarate reductase, cytochrome b subunit
VIRVKEGFLGFVRSSIGVKMVMALSGLGLWGYLIVHLLGNLQVLTAGHARFNSYAVFLKGSAPLLWGERIVVFGLMAVHAWAGIRVARLNRAARPDAYQRRTNETSTLMSRTMIASGVVVLAFFIYHILHFTVGAAGGAEFRMETVSSFEGDRVRPDAFHMVHSAFKLGPVVAIYVVGQILLFAHLLHGSTSLFQSIGLHPIFQNRTARRFASAIVLGIFAGNIAIPLIIYFAWPAA